MANHSVELLSVACELPLRVEIARLPKKLKQSYLLVAEQTTLLW
jgi:hypothetical protein